MNSIQRIIIGIAAALSIFSGGHAYAASIHTPYSWEGGDGFKSVWWEGGYSPQNQSGSIAMGIRFHERAGIILGYSDYKDYSSKEVLDSYPFDPTMGGISGIKSKPVGKKTVDGPYGFDFAYFLNPFDRLSVYATGGIYYHSWYYLNEIIDMGSIPTYSAWHVGSVYTTSERYEKVIGTYGGGLQWQAYHGDTYGLMLGASYNSLRGICGSIGMTW